MKEKICYIVGAGENHGLDFSVDSGDHVIAVDRGFSYLQEKGINADLVIGDFDSLLHIPEHPNVIALNREKDCTDTLAAVQEGIKKGYEIFHIYCGTGGRIEHTIANIQVLAFLSQRKLRGYLFGKDYVITAVTNGSISFGGGSKGYISIFASSNNAVGVYLKGLKYELDNAVITNDFSIGVSNEFVGVESTIVVNEGTLIVIFPLESMGDISAIQ